MVLDPQVSPEDIMSWEVELAVKVGPSRVCLELFVPDSTAVQRTLSAI